MSYVALLTPLRKLRIENSFVKWHRMNINDLGTRKLKDLSNDILGDVIDANDDDFKHELLKVWSAVLWPCKVLAFVKVRAATDVATALKFCHNNKVSICFSQL